MMRARTLVALSAALLASACSKPQFPGEAQYGANPRLRALARHLGPAYMRVSGTWANSTYRPAEGEVVTSPPEGFNQVLSRDQWRSVECSQAKLGDWLHASICDCSCRKVVGVRNARGLVTTAQNSARQGVGIAHTALPAANSLKAALAAAKLGLSRRWA